MPYQIPYYNSLLSPLVIKYALNQVLLIISNYLSIIYTMNNKIKEIETDELIWIIFIILSIINIYGDELYKKSLTTNNQKSNITKQIFLLTAISSLLIYFYFLSNSYKELQNTDNIELQKTKITGIILIIIGNILIIYFNINEKETEPPILP